MWRVAVVAVLVLAAPAAAPAAVVEVRTGSSIALLAEPGEANRLAIEPRGEGTRVHDAGAPLRSADSSGACRQVDEHTVVCTDRSLPWEVDTGDRDDELRLAVPASVRLGSGDDRILGDGAGSRIEGGDGADVLRGRELEGGDGDDTLTVDPAGGGYERWITLRADGGSGDDVVTGASGSDRLVGGRGSDELRGGGGDDVLLDAGGPYGADGDDPDVVDGGDGADVVSYSLRPSGVRIDLQAGTAGEAGEDRLIAIEEAAGGDGDDVIAGTAGADDLRGSLGNDLLIGGGGDDRLSGEDGHDRLDAGAGDDAADGGADMDVVDGGAGDDRDLVGGAGADTILGGAGSDRLVGGDGVDDLDGGSGDDVLSTDSDRLRDSAGCGRGADAATADVGDDLDATCEAVRRRRPEPFAPTERLGLGRRGLVVSGGEVVFGAQCNCDGAVSLWVAGRLAARGRILCHAHLRGECVGRVEPVVLALAGWAELRVYRRVWMRAVLVGALDPPGISGGALRVVQRIWLRQIWLPR
ncbi:MAG TPA: calcium-binding protein [Solirubrobacteraceae bacterium]|nr:calcium-binding protein [Solirubrobacteraceae bacterium]